MSMTGERPAHQGLVQRLCGLLVQQPHDLASLVQHLGLSEKQVKRGLAELRELNLGLTEQRGSGRGHPKVYSLPAETVPVPVQLDRVDALALRVLEQRSGEWQGRPFHRELVQLLDKLLAACDPHGRALYVKMAELLPGTRLEEEPPAPEPEVPEPSAAEPATLQEHFELLMDAARFRQVCTIRYRKPNREERSYRVHPLAFPEHNQHHYLQAWVPERNEQRRYLLDRVQDVAVHRDERFEIPPGFDPQAERRASVGIFRDRPWSVRLRFASQLATQVRERHFHATQQLQELPDGQIEVRYQAEGRPEILAQVLYWGEYVELLEPAELRAELIQRIGLMGRLYEKEPSR